MVLDDESAEVPPSDLPPSAFQAWAIVDVMGHQRYIGRMTEQVIAGCGFIRIDVPDDAGGVKFTKLIGTASIYAISPIDEAIARAMAKQLDQSPVTSYELSRLNLPAPPMTTRDRSEEYEDDDPDWPFSDKG